MKVVTAGKKNRKMLRNARKNATATKEKARRVQIYLSPSPLPFLYNATLRFISLQKIDTPSKFWGTFESLQAVEKSVLIWRRHAAPHQHGQSHASILC